MTWRFKMFLWILCGGYLLEAIPVLGSHPRMGYGPSHTGWRFLSSRDSSSTLRSILTVREESSK